MFNPPHPIFAASYPQLFFSSVSSTNENGQTVFGEEAYAPQNRANGLHRPIASSKDVDTVSQYSLRP